MNRISLFDSSKGLNLIIKTAGNSCNINCAYCFEKKKAIDSGTVTPGELEAIINKIEKTCSIVFHGGEPLIIGIEKFDELLKTIIPLYPKKVTAVRIQTNGTLLNEKWIDLIFNKYKQLHIEIAISLDGTFEMNGLRVDYDSKNTFSKVIDAFRLLDRFGISAGMLSVISKSSLPFAKEYIDYIDSINNLKFVKINALFNVKSNMLTEDSITPTEYADFIIESSAYYLKKKLYKRLPIEPFLSIIQRINHKESRYCNYSCRKCFNYLSVYPEMVMGPCDCFSVNEFPIAGSDGFLESSVIDAITSEKSDILNELINECDGCDISSFCMGGCLSQRYYFRNNESLKEEFCHSKHILYDSFASYFMK